MAKKSVSLFELKGIDLHDYFPSKMELIPKGQKNTYGFWE